MCKGLRRWPGPCLLGTAFSVSENIGQSLGETHGTGKGIQVAGPNPRWEDSVQYALRWGFRSGFDTDEE